MIKKIITMLILTITLGCSELKELQSRAEAVFNTQGQLQSLLSINTASFTDNGLRLQPAVLFPHTLWNPSVWITGTVNGQVRALRLNNGRLPMWVSLNYTSDAMHRPWETGYEPTVTNSRVEWPVGFQRSTVIAGNSAVLTAVWGGPSIFVTRTFQGARIPASFGQIHNQSILRWEFFAVENAAYTDFYIDGRYISTVTRPWTYFVDEEIRLVNSDVRYEPPVITKNEDVRILVGTRIAAVPGIEAHWYSSESFTIPELGQVLDITATQDSSGDILSSNGTTLDLLGHQLRWYEVRDLDSLGDVWVDDTTVTMTSRRVTVFTDVKPLLTLTYASGAIDANGLAIPSGVLYSPTSLHDDFIGENGWTNQPLTLNVNAHEFLGNFDTILSVHGMPNVISQSSVATIPRYQKSSLDSNGTQVYGFLSEVGDTNNKLSGTQDGLVKIDIVPPTAGANHIGEFTLDRKSVV